MKPLPIFRWFVVRLVTWPVVFAVNIAYHWHWYRPISTSFYATNEWLRRPQK